MTLLGSNYTGAYIFSTDGLEAGALIRFIVEAECEAYGNVYTAKSDVITVEVEAITDVFNVTVYFKSTSTYGYKPLISTTGTVKDVENEEMQKDIFICKNTSGTRQSSQFQESLPQHLSESCPPVMQWKYRPTL